jgi:hypothetical protein
MARKTISQVLVRLVDIQVQLSVLEKKLGQLELALGTIRKTLEERHY